MVGFDALRQFQIIILNINELYVVHPTITNNNYNGAAAIILMTQ